MLVRPGVDNFVPYYTNLVKGMDALPEDKKKAMFRTLCREDIYFLMRYGLRWDFCQRPYVYERCKFVDHIEAEHGSLANWLFLWFREGFKSSILNVAKNIQTILRDPEMCTLIMSNTSPGAKSFLFSVKTELENNEHLQKYFDEILYEKPKDSDQWSIDKGLVVKRKTNRKEATISAWGLIDSKPTKMHAERICFDDVVTPESVETEESIKKTSRAMSISQPLLTNIEGREGHAVYVGTRYADSDYYGEMIESGAYHVDIIPWHEKGKPRCHTMERIEFLRKTMSKYDFNTQYELDPTPTDDRKFYSPLKHYGELPGGLNHIILVDPAGESKAKRGHDPDYTAIAVIGRDYLGHEYLVDGYRGRINLLPRINLLFKLIRKYRVEEVWYERVGKDSDVVTIHDYMERSGTYFTLHEFSPNKYGEKNRRIESALMPRIETAKLRFPFKLVVRNEDGTETDLIACLKEEMRRFPNGKHDDFIDCLAQLIAVPAYGEDRPLYDPKEDQRIAGTYSQSISDMEAKRKIEDEAGTTYQMAEYL
jgi:phage terminase large subunit-like protein